MNKKGVAWGTIVTAIVALIVLLIIVWIFKEQISEVSSKFFEIIKQTGDNAGDLSESIKDLAKDK